jgi:probable phosphoglycerate mutase
MRNQEQNPTRIIMVRHGRTLYNEQGLIQGVRDVPLSLEGEKHAQAILDKLVERYDFGEEANSPTVVSSGLIRSNQTAEVINDTLRQINSDRDSIIETAPDFQERDYREWAGKSSEDFFKAWLENAKKTDSPEYPWDVQVESAVETYREMAERVQKALLGMHESHRGEDVVAVSHGAFIHCLLMLLRQVTNEFDARKIYNMAQIVIEINDMPGLTEDENGPLLKNVSLTKIYDLEKPRE